MKQFKYKAKKKSGETVEGHLPALTRDEAVTRINDLGLLPVVVQESKSEDASRTNKPRSKTPYSEKTAVKLRPRDLVSLYRQWGRMLRAGIPILKSLAILEEQSQHGGIQEMTRQIYEDVKQGRPVSEAVLKFPKVFLEFDTALIRAGETVGRLSEILLEIADYREKQLKLSSKIKSALSYPAFVFIVGAGTVYFMMAQVIPQFSHFFSDLGQTLPLPTRILMAVSLYVQSYGWLFVLALTVLAILLKSSLKTKSNRTACDRFLLRLPVLGPLIIKAETARITRTLELLLANGLSLVKALHAVYPVCTNELFRLSLERSCKKVEEGGTLSESLLESRLYPVMVTYLIRTGEESGNLRESMTEIAEWYESEVQDSLQMVTKLIEPVSILLIGLVIGGIVISLLLPVFSMSVMVS